MGVLKQGVPRDQGQQRESEPGEARNMRVNLLSLSRQLPESAPDHYPPSSDSGANFSKETNVTALL